MSCKILYYKLDVEYPPRTIQIVIGKQMARDYVDHYCEERSSFLQHFILAEEGDNAVFLWQEDGAYMICLPTEYDDTCTYHECFHAAMRIWYDAGADLTFPENDEVITYMQTLLVDKIKEIYNGHQE